MVVSLPRRDCGRDGRGRGRGGPRAGAPGEAAAGHCAQRNRSRDCSSSLEAKFANNAPDSAPYMVKNDDATTTIAEVTGTAVVSFVIGGDDIVSV